MGQNTVIFFSLSLTKKCIKKTLQMWHVIFHNFKDYFEFRNLHRIEFKIKQGQKLRL